MMGRQCGCAAYHGMLALTDLIKQCEQRRWEEKAKKFTPLEPQT